MKLILPMLLIISFVNKGYCQEMALSAIPEELKKHAHSIIREEKLSFEIKGPGKAYFRTHRVTTLLDAVAKDELRFVFETGKFQSLEDISITLFNAKGGLVKKFTRKDFFTFNMSDEATLLSDGKKYILDIPNSDYPVHIQYDDEWKYNGALWYPAYFVQRPQQAIENSSYTVTVPSAQDLRYKENITSLQPVITTDKNNRIYQWSVKNIPALEYEPGSIQYGNCYPGILLAPNEFELDGYEGNMSSWEKFGEWYGNLSKDALDLTAERKQFFRDMVKQATTDREKAALVYNYLQRNCRYVSIQLGIGGFKPFEASFVDKKKYGDCKALSNYTQACLEAVGIKSYQALINAQYNSAAVDPAFPINSFNHVILCVPQDKDSIWLECTSNTAEFAVLGSFTENKNALLITESGGKLVPTPASRSRNNILHTNTTIRLNEDGSGIAQATIYSKGAYRYLNLINENKDYQRRYIVQALRFQQPDEFTLKADPVEPGRIYIELEIEKIPSFTAGNKTFLSPRISRLWDAALPAIASRTKDYYFEFPLLKTDTTRYTLPGSYQVESLPAEKKIEFTFGNFISSFYYDKASHSIMNRSRLELVQNRIPAHLYNEARLFFNKVMAEHEEKIVIKKGL